MIFVVIASLSSEMYTRNVQYNTIKELPVSFEEMMFEA